MTAFCTNSFSSTPSCQKGRLIIGASAEPRREIGLLDLIFIYADHRY